VEPSVRRAFLEQARSVELVKLNGHFLVKLEAISDQSPSDASNSNS
jgi:hypothetical protein